MSLSGSLLNAYSGLVAASRGAETVSQNVANALTEGFGRREIALSAGSLNGRGIGVRVDGVLRDVDQVAITDRRLSEAGLSKSGVLTSAYARIERVIGIPGEGNSLSDRASAFAQALNEAGSRPDSEVRLQRLTYAATDLANHLNAIGDESQAMRLAADHDIGDLVDRLNSTLSGIADLNRSIRIQQATGRDANGLMDQRQALVDTVAGMVPIRTYPRDFGGLAITSAGGAMLLDGKPAEFAFSRATMITADMTLASGALSGLTLNGKAVTIGTGSGSGLLDGGALAAEFEVRDAVAPFAAAEVDALARNLIERLQDPLVDPTLAVGDAGLFTDMGSAFDPLLETGLASRIRINSRIDPDQGGDLWRLRDGLGAATPGPVGDGALLVRMADAYTLPILPASGQFSVGR
ncbi:MAG: flagellar hook-associated protein FlgK, partial [Paracoccaceae bacterium]